MGTNTIAPDVGALVEYGLDGFNRGPGLYRVDGWMRVAAAPKLDPNDWLGKILFEGCQKIRGKRMQWCTRAEATHLSLSGVGGAIARVEDCKVTGMVDWPEEHLAEARESARRLGESHTMLF